MDRKPVLVRIFVAVCLLVIHLTLAPHAFAQGCATCSAGTITCANQAITTGDPDAGQGLAVSTQQSSCSIPTGCPTPAVTGATRYDRYTFTNTLGVTTCFTVAVNNNAAGCGISLFSAAYTPTFVPGVGSTCTNYLADVGVPVTNLTSAGYSFTLAAAQQVEVVVYNRNIGEVCTPTGTYTLTITPCGSAPTAANGIVSGRIADNSGAPVAGTVVALSGSQSRKTITDAKGNYYFDDVETTGFYTVTPSRANYSFSPANRSFSQLGNHTDAAFTGSSNGDSANPLDTPEYFVRQQYVDILGREPDEGGFNYWSSEVNLCEADRACVERRRRDVAAAFFIEQEFQDTGSFVYGLYKASFGVRPTFAQYKPDRKRVIGGPNLALSREALAADFVQREAFRQAYPDGMTNEQFVNKLYETAGLPYAVERDLAINRMRNGATRGQILEGVIANGQFARAEYNAAFVLTEYFGYLQRDPEPEGYNFWLNVVTHGDVGNYRGMVCSFITSTEYQKRFSANVTHNNGECGN